ncbi:MAG: glycine dehydrogenase subunit 2 [Lentisphaerae bacterium]|nr:glycine dehydrogenase subunit 2 [Lentisphaerota bacterium]
MPGRRGCTLPKLTPAEEACHLRIPERYRATQPPELPEVSELDVVRHFTNLSRLNFSVDSHLYPLGSCTMKYNPRICEKIAALDGFAGIHPLLPQLRGGGMLTQGALEVLYETERLLTEICGMGAFSLQPMAGAHGELTGIMLIAAYHRAHGNRRSTVIVPDSSHGTNPASAAMAGYEVVTVPSGPDGCMDLEAFKAVLNDDVAAVMMTCPNTLGLFEKQIHEIADLAHAHDALLYYDGANLNALLGHCRPGDLGFDVVHVNLHKTFATPHGGGGPGAGPVGVVPRLAPYLPVSQVVKRSDGTFALDYDCPKSIGYIAPFYGNFGVVLRAYAYLLLLGRNGLTEVADHAVLNANYVRARLKPYYDLPYDRTVMHECVFSALRQCAKGVHAIDIAKALIDEGFHPPTVYFPLTVKEALMIEPTETESKEAIDRFIEAMIRVARLAEADPAAFAEMPQSTPVSRLDETRAVKAMRFGV